MIIYLPLSFPTILAIIQVLKLHHMKENADHHLDGLTWVNLPYLVQILFIKIWKNDQTVARNNPKLKQIIYGYWNKGVTVCCR